MQTRGCCSDNILEGYREIEADIAHVYTRRPFDGRRPRRFYIVVAESPPRKISPVIKEQSGETYN